MKNKLLIFVCFLLLGLMVSCAANDGYYTEDGYYVVENGEFPETLPDIPRVGIGFIGGNSPVTLEDFEAKGRKAGYQSFIVIRAKKKNSTSYTHCEDPSLAYTITEMDILDVYVNEGSSFQGYKTGDVIQILEPYAYVPDKKEPSFISTSFIATKPNTSSAFNYLEYTAWEYIVSEKEYVIVLQDVMASCYKEGKVTNFNGNHPIITEENMKELFFPSLLRAIDRNAFDEMNTLDNYRDKSLREQDFCGMEQSFKYVYYDILNQYVFAEK